MEIFKNWRMSVSKTQKIKGMCQRNFFKLKDVCRKLLKLNVSVEHFF